MTISSLLKISIQHLSDKSLGWLVAHQGTEVHQNFYGPGLDHEFLSTSSLEGVHAFPFDGGWLICCEDEASQAHFVPQDVRDLIDFGITQGADWIMLDDRAERCDSLPFYEAY